MKVTKDIVRDLLPAYLAGECSAETRAVVQEYLAQHADLRQLVKAARNDSPPPFSAPAGFEVRSLERTRRLLGQKNFWLGFALIFCLAAPIVKPLRLADVVMLIGMAGWAPFLIACKRLMATGLEAPRGWDPRYHWAIVGGLLGLAVYVLIEQHKGWRASPFHIAFWMSCMFVQAAFLASCVGELLHQIQTGPQANGPYITTLFGKEPDR